MAKKKSFDSQITKIKNSFEKGDIKGMVFIVIDKNDELLIGAEGLDESATLDLLVQGVDIMGEIASNTLH